MRKPAEIPVGGAVLGTPIVGELFSGHKAVWEMMTDDKWDDGTSRARSTLLLICDGSVVKLWLNDRALQRAAWVSGDSLEAAMEALDHGIAEDSLAWKPQADTRKKK